MSSKITKRDTNKIKITEAHKKIQMTANINTNDQSLAKKNNIDDI